MNVKELEQRALELASIGEGVSPREMVDNLKNAGAGSSEEEVNLALRKLFDEFKVELSGSFKIVAIKTSKDENCSVCWRRSWRDLLVVCGIIKPRNEVFGRFSR